MQDRFFGGDYDDPADSRKVTSQLQSLRAGSGDEPLPYADLVSQRATKRVYAPRGKKCRNRRKKSATK